MTPAEFVKKWSAIQLKEQTTAQTHFNDVCALVAHPEPLDYDPDGKIFTFEMYTDEGMGKRGRADVWYKGKFIWEYKGPGRDLDKAYQQLLRYREALDNPPLLITSDTNKIIIHTNFTGTVKEIHTVTFDNILQGDGVELLKRVFYHPDSFKPTLTRDQVTEATAATFLHVADTLKKYDPSADPEKVAHFLIQLLFTIFAEDMALLPNGIFTRLVQQHHGNPKHLDTVLRLLFKAMKEGGFFGIDMIPHFNGPLFDYEYIPNLPSDLTDPLLNAASQNWANINPTIFGTLFERIIDDSKRSQLGAHYTGVDDILLIVEPVLMQPLRVQWETTRTAARRHIRDGKLEKANALVAECAQMIANTTVLDPACGSGNFLYVALQELLGLQKEVIAYAESHGLDPIPLTVSPHQLYGIEINPYAHELAQITIWIGYIQWRFENGLGDIEEPILRPINQIERKNAIIAYDDKGNPVEPVWPTVDVIMGNPPFLGTKLMRSALGDEHVREIHELYKGKLPKDVDLVCYWFYRANQQNDHARLRVGLLSTNSIRGGANRAVLEQILEKGQIFSAWSDKEWVLEGAAVRISIVCFDRGQTTRFSLDGQRVQNINADLTSSIDLTQAKKLGANKSIAFMGDTKQGAFDITRQQAKEFLALQNRSGRSNADVIKRWVNGRDITRYPREMHIIDFGIEMSEEEASQYEAPYQYVREHVKPVRDKNKRSWYRDEWWLHYATRPAMRAALALLERFIVTPTVAKYRSFVWLEKNVLPDHQLIAFARGDDYFLGVLHSKLHEMWSLRMGSWLGQGNDPRYTPTTTFETFPFPWNPGDEPNESDNKYVYEIAQSARELVIFRQGWLHPPTEEIGVSISEKQLKKRTLTNLYNALTIYRDNPRISMDAFVRASKTDLTLTQIQELNDIHRELDHAVLDAYGWSHDLSDEQILEKLLALNLERAEAQENETQ